MNKHCVNHKKDSPSPITQNYSEKIKNKENQSTPYGADEPSTKPTYK